MESKRLQSFVVFWPGFNMNVRQKLQLATSVSVVAYFGIASTENDNKHEISVVGLSGRGLSIKYEKKVEEGTNTVKNSGIQCSCDVEMEARPECTSKKGCSLAQEMNKNNKSHF